MAGVSLQCEDCGALLKSVEEVQEHAKLTSHFNFAESTEPVPNIVCSTCRKSFRSKTERNLHRKRTGHAEFVDKTSEAAKPINLESPINNAGSGSGDAAPMDVDASGSGASEANDGQGAGHVCRKCGWPYPIQNPSAKRRKTHKKYCGTIEGYKLDNDARGNSPVEVNDGEHNSDDDLKTLSADNLPTPDLVEDKKPQTFQRVEGDNDKLEAGVGFNSYYQHQTDQKRSYQDGKSDQTGQF